MSLGTDIGSLANSVYISGKCGRIYAAIPFFKKLKNKRRIYKSKEYIFGVKYQTIRGKKRETLKVCLKSR